MEKPLKLEQNDQGTHGWLARCWGLVGGSVVAEKGPNVWTAGAGRCLRVIQGRTGQHLTQYSIDCDEGMSEAGMDP